VVSRPGHRIEALAERLPSLAARMELATAASRRAPGIYLLQTPTPDVSSTALRERLRRGESVSGLVPALVEHHIRQHRLYSPAD
jgi:nicotinic acid mononucleotide adenylyltransferase